MTVVGKDQRSAKAPKAIKTKGDARSVPKDPSTAMPASVAEQAEVEDEPFPGHVEICRELNELKTEIKKFSESFRRPIDKGSVLSSLLDARNEQLLRYIGCLALGGTNSARDWEALLNDEACRHALVFGIIGRALKEHVFAELYFGAGKALRQKLDELQVESFQQDGECAIGTDSFGGSSSNVIAGFFRVRERANEILNGAEKKINQLDLQNAIATVTTRLGRLLLPFWTQGSTEKGWEVTKRSTQLARIVEMAAKLSRKMQKDSETVYYWPPTMKDEEFEPERMECYNLRCMMSDSPYLAEKIKGMDRGILQAGNENRKEAIVRVVCFPGLVAHRQGGGDFVSYEDRQKRDQGFRTAVLSKSVVLLQWGKQRALTREAGTSRHILAKKNGDMSRYTDSEQTFKGLFDLYLQHKAGKDVFGESPQRSSFFSLPRSLSGSPSRLMGG